jgi:hypothetical protein
MSGVALDYFEQPFILNAGDLLESNRHEATDEKERL